MTNHADIVKRLRAFPANYPRPFNPDGPEAAALIEALAERVRELEGARDMLMRELPDLLSDKAGLVHEGNNVAVRSAIRIVAICFAPARKDQDNG
jgi:hypothetical protein